MEAGCAESGAPDAGDPDLARLVAAWPALPEPIKPAVLTLMGSASENKKTRK